MRIECPSCGAAYEVPDSVLIPGRLLRCAQCARDWMPGGGLAEGRVEVAEAVVPAPADPVAADPPSPLAVSAPLVAASPGKAAVLAAWAGSFLVLGALGWSAVAWRATVMHAWPPSARLYAVLGLG